MSTFRLVDAAETLYLSQIATFAYTLHLFTNDVTDGRTPEEIDELAAGDFTEATFTGYATAAVGTGDWTITAGNPSKAVNLEKSFTSTIDQAAEEIQGYYLTIDFFGGALIGFEQLEAPITIEFLNDQINVVPTLTLDDTEANVVPTGSILAYAVDAAAGAPTGWLLCDGAAVSRTTFAELFAVIGTAYGIGDGSTTFNVPDTRQRFLLGQAASGVGVNVGDAGGSISHTHLLDGAGAGAAFLFTTSAPELRVRRKTIDEFTTTHAMNTTEGIAADATVSATGVELVGATDDENPPFVTTGHIIKT